MLFDPDKSWYHGSPRRLTILRAGSTITQNKELARIFSHKPAVVVGDHSGQRWKHSGPFSQGVLYRLTEAVSENDIEPVPNTSLSPGVEWNTRKEFGLELVSETDAKPEELLTKHELREMAADGLIDGNTAGLILKNQDLPD
jgi:hypothetical protein